MERFDVIVIGGGVAGLSLAAALAPQAQLLLLEGEAQFATQASGRSAALYEPFYGAGPVVTLSQASGAAFRALPGILSPRGLMLVAGPEEEALFQRDRTALQVEPITPDEAVARVPLLARDKIGFAAAGDHAWDIDTDLLLQGFIRQARAAGARLETKARVESLAPGAGGLWCAAWAGGAAEAPLVVNAAGAWADQIAALAGLAPLGLQPMRRSMARLAVPGGHDARAWPMIMTAGERWYAKPDAGALLVSPAEEEPRPPEDAWPDDMVLAEGLHRFQEMITAEVTRPLATWAGLRSFAPDRAPILGPDPAAPGFFWLAGQGGYGFQTCPAMAQLAAELILGEAPHLPELIPALSPARFAR